MAKIIPFRPQTTSNPPPEDGTLWNENEEDSYSRSLREDYERGSPCESHNPSFLSEESRRALSYVSAFIYPSTNSWLASQYKEDFTDMQQDRALRVYARQKLAHTPPEKTVTDRIFILKEMSGRPLLGYMERFATQHLESVDMYALLMFFMEPAGDVARWGSVIEGHRDEYGITNDTKK